MLRHTVIVSDVHLTTLVAPPVDARGGWMVYRSAAVRPDAHLARMIDGALLQAARERALLELVLDGDLFDLDAPPAASAPDPRSYEACRSHAAPAIMEDILADHPEFVAALRRVLECGHRVVFIPGNHDAQLALPGVSDKLVEAIDPVGNLGTRPLFRGWFHVTPDGVLVEHGHQYDPLCVMERMFARGFASPNGSVRARLEDTVGSVGTHYGQELFAEKNPYGVDPFAGLRGRDVSAALRACIERSQCDGAARVFGALRDLMLVRREGDGPDVHAWLEHVARQTGVPRMRLDVHRALAAQKADASDVAAAVTREYDYAADVDRRLRAAMREIAVLHGVRAVVTGHTHEPFLERAPSGVVLANAGAWAPDTSTARGPVGTYVWLASDGRAALRTVWPDGSERAR